jgi:2,4-dienoyl-CoA reductase-like NADH-dependent reductase (Old Yellow Enzyme family)
LNDGIDKPTGVELLKTKKADAISFASLALGNPDLPERFKSDWELA